MEKQEELESFETNFAKYKNELNWNSDAKVMAILLKLLLNKTEISRHVRIHKGFI